ncbi:MAG: glycosyl hydrolase 115 family protein [Bacteroidota bacterium]
MKKSIYVVMLFLFISNHLSFSFDQESYVTTKKVQGSFTLVENGKSAAIVISKDDFPGIHRVSKHLQNDIKNVSGAEPNLLTDTLPSFKEIVLIGTIGKNPLIDKLINENKINVQEIAGKWESFLIQVVDKPFSNVDRALIISGSDKRGTIYGIYNLSEQIGVSPWYWWADVPVKKKTNIYILPTRFTLGEPKVKYRGIFINDEIPALSGWSQKKFGGFNHKFYEHVFELILRLKGNFLWPAMWGSAFYDDDPLNPKLADEYGVVISTSHHEPMMRAHDEWRRYGSGPWNYEKNDSALRKFWRDGIERMGNYESIITLAMRGDGDEAMSPEANVSLLEKIVADQRDIIADVTKKDITTIPQVWALYKEVQEYYEKGMRVPDDVTILLCDDNWGNLRLLPKLSAPQRKGGYGIYYHYDFVGGPRNYKWLNTNQIERVWEQMHLAYEYGAREIWIVNVGDIKPMEFPTQFFLDYAWDPEKISASDLPEYSRLWAEKQFGNKYSNEIADILNKYTKFNSRRKPEMLYADTYSLTNYREAETIVAEYNALVEKAKKIGKLLPADYDAAFYQLVLHQPEACANLNELYVTVGKNRLYALQGRASTNDYAKLAKQLFEKDSSITYYYNNIMADGKWAHMMDQTHIGYTSWQQPDKNYMPEVKVINISDEAEMGVAVEGSKYWWAKEQSDAVLPEFDSFNKQAYFIEIFNRGKKDFNFVIKVPQPWIIVSDTNGKIEKEKRIFVSIDWKKAPVGKQLVPIIINGTGTSVTVNLIINNYKSIKVSDDSFVESNGYVSMKAENFYNAVETDLVKWTKIPNLGRTASAMIIEPVTVQQQTLDDTSPRLEYKIHFFSKGEMKVNLYLSPTLNFQHTQGLRYAVSFNNEPPQIVNIHIADTIPDWKYPNEWNQKVGNNIKVTTTVHSIKEEGEHILKVWAVDPGVVFQKIVVETYPLGVKQSYLGPPQSYNRNLSNKKYQRR